MKEITALIVTYNPDIERFKKVIKAVYPQVKDITIIDNASSNIKEIKSLIKGKPKINLIKLKENVGIAEALNIGIAKNMPNAITEPKESRQKWFLTLDDDTIIYKGAVKEILKEYKKLSPKIKKDIGVIGMSFEESSIIGIGWKYGWFTEKFVITSGNLIKAEVFNIIKYDKELFIDWVDYKFCYDCKFAGFRIIEYDKITMSHRIGEEQGIKGYEPAWRLFYMTRNATYLAKQGKLPLSIAFTSIAGFYRKFLKVHGIKAVPTLSKVFILGLVGGIQGKLGKSKMS